MLNPAQMQQYYTGPEETNLVFAKPKGKGLGGTELERENKDHEGNSYWSYCLFSLLNSKQQTLDKTIPVQRCNSYHLVLKAGSWTKFCQALQALQQTSCQAGGILSNSAPTATRSLSTVKWETNWGRVKMSIPGALNPKTGWDKVWGINAWSIWSLHREAEHRELAANFTR